MFNIEKARKDGHSDLDIAMELSTKHKFDFARATEDGYKLDEIIEDLANKPISDISPETTGAPFSGDLPVSGGMPPLTPEMEQYGSDLGRPMIDAPDYVPEGVEPSISPSVKPSKANWGEVALEAPIKSVVPSLGMMAGGMEIAGAERDLEKLDYTEAQMRMGTGQEAEIKKLGKRRDEILKERQEGIALFRGSKETMVDIQPDVEYGTPKYYVGAALQSVAQMAPSLTASIATGNPLPSMVYMGMVSGGIQYGELIEAGIDPTTARYASLGYALAEGVPEAFPVGVMLKGGKAFTRILKTAGAETVQEEVTEALQMAIDKGTISPDMTWKEAKQRFKDVAIISPIAGGVMAGATQPFVGKSLESYAPEIQTAIAKEASKNKEEVQLTKEKFEKYAETSEFKKWFGKSRVADDENRPFAVYHGTTHPIETFSTERGNIENDFGIGFYFSNSTEDINENYATMESPDLTGRIERRAEEIEADEEIDMEEARLKAQKEMSGAAPNILPVYLQIKKPVIVGGREDTFLDFNQELDEETGDIITEEGGLVDFVEELRSLEQNFSGLQADDIAADIFENLEEEGIYVSDLMRILEGNEGLIYAEDLNSGGLASNEIVRQTFEGMGFDGIIDKTVNEKFGLGRTQGKKMGGMEEDTTHYIVFKPSQIKSIFETPKKVTKKLKKEFVPRGTKPVEKVEVKPAKESVVTGELPKKPLLGDEKGEVSLEGAEEIPGRLKKAGTAVKEFFTPFSTIPQAKAYEELRYRTLGKLDRVEGVISKIWKRTKDLPSENKKQLFDFLAGRIEKTALPVKLQPMGVSLRTQHNLVGKMLVDRGLMTQETYEKNKDSYIKFMYLKHLEGGTKGGRGLKLGLSYQKGRMDPTIKEVDGMYQVVSKGGHKYSKATLTKTGADKKQKTVQSEVDEYRRSIGLVEDVSVAAPSGLASTLSDITKFDFMKEMSTNPDWVWQDSIVTVNGKRMGIGKLEEEIATQKSVVEQAPNVPEAKKRLETMENAMAEATAKTDKMPEDFVQLPVAKAYGDLSGAYIRKEIALDIQPVVRMFSDASQFGKIVNAGIKAEEQLVGAFKVGKVALNPPTIARNILSNQIQLNMSGIPLHKIPMYWVKTAKAMKAKSQYYVEAKRQGIFRTNWALTEIDEVLDTVKTMEKDGYAGIVGTIGKLAKFYGKIDDFFKLLKYIEQREGGATKGTASREAQKWVMDYSRATPSIKFARKHLLPMVTFQYKIMPLIAEAAVKRPWVIAKYMMIPYLMNEMAKENLDIDDEEWKKLEKQLPEYVRDSGVYTLYPVRSPEGNLQWVNLEYYVPWQGIIGLNQMAKKGDYNEAIGDVVRHPILDVITSFKTAKGEDPPKDTFTGREIYNRLDDSKTKALKTAEWLTSKWAPSAFTRGGALHKSFKVGDKDRYGRTITKSQAAGKWVGFNIVAPTKKQANLEKRRRLKAVDRAIFKVVIDPTNSKEYVKKIRAAGKKEKEKILEYYGKGE